MIYYRSDKGDHALSLGAARGITLGALALYPLGATLVAAARGAPGLQTASYALALVAAGLAVSIIGTTLQRIVGEVPTKLDEYELILRSRAVGAAYKALTSVVLAGVLYIAIGGEAGLWVPRGYAAFNGIFWGVFLYATMLPSAFLAWQAEPADLAGED